MEPVIVKCVSTLKHMRIPAFGVVLKAGENAIKNTELLKFLLRFPSKIARVDPQECIDKGHLTVEEVVALGHEVAGSEPAKAEDLKLDIEIPEAMHDPVLMTKRELIEFCDDERHPVKYKSNWSKDQFVKAIKKEQRRIKKEREEKGK